MLHRYVLTGIYLTLFAIIAVPAYSQTELLDPGSDQEPAYLSLNDCLEIADVSNISLQRTRIGVGLSLLERMRAESVFDPGFELDLSGGSARRSGGTGSTGTNSNMDFGARYNLPTTIGGSWVFSLDQTRDWGSTTTDQQSVNFTTYNTQLGLTYSMPLFEGSGDFINRVGIIKSNISINRAELSVNEAKRGLRASIIEAYVNAVLAAVRIDVALLSLETASALVDEVQARIDVGQLAEYELLSAQSGLAERQESLINANSAFQTSLDTLKNLTGIPISREIGIDTDFLTPLKSEYLFDELFIQAQRNRRDLDDLDLRLQQAELDRMLAADRVQPSLTWNTVMGLSGEGGSYSRSIESVGDFNWFTGLSYKIPLGGNRAARADFQSSGLNIDQINLEKTDFLRNLEWDIRSALENLSNANLRIDVTEEGLHVQEIKLERERQRFSLGLITSRDLLDFDLELANAHLAYYRAMADSILAVSRIEFLVNDSFLPDSILLNTDYYEDGQITQ
jgi:outer membrane protein TolC